MIIKGTNKSNSSKKVQRIKYKNWYNKKYPPGECKKICIKCLKNELKTIDKICEECK